ncbi:hypothetical protein ACH3XW_37140 [Acanthocheilonema viteae]
MSYTKVDIVRKKIKSSYKSSKIQIKSRKKVKIQVSKVTQQCEEKKSSKKNEYWRDRTNQPVVPKNIDKSTCMSVKFLNKTNSNYQ